MRFVHDIENPMQVGGGGHPYTNSCGKQGFNGGHVDICIASSPAVNHPELPPEMFDDHEVIHIEGNSTYIIPMLESALDMLKGLEKSWREDMGELRSTNCPDGCEDIKKSGGTHEITCPRHVNYEYFKNNKDSV